MFRINLLVWLVIMITMSTASPSPKWRKLVPKMDVGPKSEEEGRKSCVKKDEKCIPPSRFAEKCGAPESPKCQRGPKPCCSNEVGTPMKCHLPSGLGGGRCMGGYYRPSGDADGQPSRHDCDFRGGPMRIIKKNNSL